MGNYKHPHLSPNLHFNLHIKMPKRKSRSEMGWLNTLSRLLGNVDGGHERKVEPDCPSNNPLFAAAVGMRMPSVLELVNGLHQHKAAAAAAALRGE